MSLCEMAIVAAKRAVNEPTIAIKTIGVESRPASTLLPAERIGKVRMTRYTPAETMAAAWIIALTGVGPFMASGSQTCSGNCDDLPMVPVTMQIPIRPAA